MRMYNQRTKIFATNDKLMRKCNMWNKCKRKCRKWRISRMKLKSKSFYLRRLQRRKRTKWLKTSCLKASKMNINLNIKWTNLYKVKYMEKGIIMWKKEQQRVFWRFKIEIQFRLFLEPIILDRKRSWRPRKSYLIRIIHILFGTFINP